MEMKQLVMGAALVMLGTGAAYGQNIPASASQPAAAASATVPVSLADQSSQATFDSFEPRAQAAADDPEEKGTWDNIKRGFYAGLVVGGLVGAIRAADCGHPECGPIFPFYAGVGAAIGLGIDALFPEPCAAATGTAHGGAPRPALSAGAGVTLRFRKSW